MKLLLVEDSIQLNKALSTILKKHNYTVDSVFDGEEALDCLQQYSYDVIVLDIMLPKINGLEVLKRARENNISTPIIMLTAKATTEDKIAGLDMGADDYLPKPFNSDELLARIRSLLRRKPTYSEKQALTFGDLSFDLDKLLLSKDDKNVTLMNKEAQIMQLLMKQNGGIVSLESICQNAWDIDSYISSENVWVFVSYLRKKIEQLESKVKIKSIRYQGYYLEYKA